MARELELLRQRYMGHRETLVRLEADAPSEELAARYRALQQEIDRAVHKLGELTAAGGEAPQVRRTQPASNRLPSLGDDTIAAGAAAAAAGAAARHATAPGDRPLHHATATPRPAAPSREIEPAPAEDKKRLMLIVAAAALMLMILGALVWRARRDETPTRIVEEQPVAAAPVEAPVERVADTGVLSVSPASHDFGVVRKGTRAVRQFRLENGGNEPVNVSIDRSTCRCLWFDFDSTIPAKSSSILAITVDGARAKVGRLDETVKIKNKADAVDMAEIKLFASVE